MSQLSLSRRIERLLDVVLPPGSRDRAVYDLPPALRLRYDNWVSDCERVIQDAERTGGPGASYERLLDGSLVTPEMPVALRAAMGLIDPPSITEATSCADAARMYNAFAHGRDR